MISPDTRVKTESGAKIRVGQFVAAGGQGEVYRCTEEASGLHGMLKVFHARFSTPDTVKRLSFLVRQDLKARCPVLCAPIDAVNKRNMVGHYTPLVPGDSLEQFLSSPGCTFVEQIQLAVALAHGAAVMHALGITHGDLHAENLFVHRSGSALELGVIDFDNFSHPSLPYPPPCVGHELYIAPELRSAMATGGAALPTVESERFALAVLFHEIVLLTHLCAGHDSTEADFQKAMCAGAWLSDPAAATRTSGAGGYPPAVLNADLARLFRGGFSLDPAERPSADAWEAALRGALESVHACDRCGGPCLIDSSKVECPLCRAPFPHLTLQVCGTGLRLPLTGATTLIGRAELGGALTVSKRHCVFRKIGPETWIETFGTNGTFRWNGSGWTRLPDRKAVLVQAGDRLRLADVDVKLA